MEHVQNLISKKVAIVGGGPAGCFCAYFLQDKFDVTIFDYGSPLRTLLPTGGGKCNLAHAEFDFKELAKNYPRGEKFLYSVFSKFSTTDTVKVFKNIGIETYVRNDNRIFPTSENSKDVRGKILQALKKVIFKKEVISKLDFKTYDYIVVATGGHSSYALLKGHTIISPKPALTGFKTTEKFPQGITIKNITCQGITDDILFTHEGISGPLIYKISSINARKQFPYKISLNFCKELDLQTMLNENSKKDITNLLATIVPKGFAQHLSDKLNLSGKCHQIDGKTRDKIVNLLQNYEIEVVSPSSKGEVVTCGGVSLDEVNPKTMESKIIPNLYFCGEVLDIDGFCGGFNLQNCWSTAYVTANTILNKFD